MIYDGHSSRKEYEDGDTFEVTIHFYKCPECDFTDEEFAGREFVG